MNRCDTTVDASLISQNGCNEGKVPARKLPLSGRIVDGRFTVEGLSDDLGDDARTKLGKNSDPVASSVTIVV